MAKYVSKIHEQRERANTGIISQNGNNPSFYRVYDEEGRVLASKEGIVTVPAEMQPRSGQVDKKNSVEQAYKPRIVGFDDLKEFVEN